MENELNKCTFKPKINKEFKNNQTSCVVNGLDSFLARKDIALKKKEEKKSREENFI